MDGHPGVQAHVLGEAEAAAAPAVEEAPAAEVAPEAETPAEEKPAA